MLMREATITECQDSRNIDGTHWIHTAAEVASIKSYQISPLETCEHSFHEFFNVNFQIIAS